MRILALFMGKQPGRKTTRYKARSKGTPYSRTEAEGNSDNNSDNNVQENTEPSSCPICEEVIKEATDDSPGDEAIYCEGQCEAWFHRKCAGISKKAYEQAGESENPFYCMSCLQVHYNQEISQLKEQLALLFSKIPKVTEGGSNQQLDQTYPETCAVKNSLKPPTVISQNDAPRRPADTSARKFNVVLSGLPECPPGTKKPDRNYADLKSATGILTEVDSSIQPLSIRDTVRLGKFNPTGRPRPMLVTLNRSTDVTSILSKRSQVKPPYVIKPDLSREARIIESHLLKARWSLLQNNTPKSDVKIRGNKLFVKGKLFGQADINGFTSSTNTAAATVVPTAAPMDATATSSST